MLAEVQPSYITTHRKKIAGERIERGRQVARLLRRLSPAHWFREFSEIPVTLEEMEPVSRKDH